MGFSQSVCQPWMNSHSVLSSFPPRGQGTAVCEISQCVKRQQSGAEVKKDQSARRAVRLAGWSHFLHHGVFKDWGRFLSSTLVSKNKESINLSAGPGI